MKKWKWLRFEFWPVYVFYLPCIPVWLYYAIRSRDLWYFLKVNPGMKLGGFMQYSKYDVLASIPDQFSLQTLRLNKSEIDPDHPPLPFPFICKPDLGERGLGVEIVNSKQELIDCLNNGLGPAYILQEFCDSNLEFGVLYHRYPSGKSGVTSIVQKEFLSITGDGMSTFEMLVKKEFRARKRLEHLEEKYSHIWYDVLDKDRTVVIEKIGNHCRGTKFIDRRDLITPELIAVFDKVAGEIPGFHYGRFDLKLNADNPEFGPDNIHVFELNGVNSEAGHIYDPNMSIWGAYKSVYREFRIVFEIVKELNAEKKATERTAGVFFKSLYSHLRRRAF